MQNPRTSRAKDERNNLSASSEKVRFARFRGIHGISLLAVGTSAQAVTLCEPAAGVDQLDNVDKLLEQHDRGRDAGDNPGPEAVDLVGAGHLKSAGTPGASEETARHGVGRVSGLHRGGLGITDRLEERRREDRRGEGEQIEADEEKLIESAANEQDNLVEQQESVLTIHTDQLPVGLKMPYPAVVVLVEDPAAAGVDLLVALIGTAHA